MFEAFVVDNCRTLDAIFIQTVMGLHFYFKEWSSFTLIQWVNIDPEGQNWNILFCHGSCQFFSLNVLHCCSSAPLALKGLLQHEVSAIKTLDYIQVTYAEDGVTGPPMDGTGLVLPHCESFNAATIVFE